MKRINIAVIFGGKSAEHEVSLQSAKNVYDALNKEKYNPVLIGIDKSGSWLLYERSQFLINENDPKSIRLNKSDDSISVNPENGFIVSNRSGSGSQISIDVAFPILHGPFGEDGTVQGLLKLANIPFVGASVLGSAVGMDKDIMKRLLREAKLPTPKFITLRSDDPVPDFSGVVKRLGLPFFIKPANMGSSVGVSKVHGKEEYEQSMKKAFSFDLKILIEEFIHGREIECSVLGNNDPIASVPGEIKTRHDFYSYESKYIDEKGAILEIPANVSGSISNKIRELSIKAFKTLSCEGLGRVDFFLGQNEKVFINEINTIPGFTKISMYPKLWEASGISYEGLIDRLLELAFERFEKEKNLKTNYF
ncbi:MAG: D-alanine--D-alanine ligase [Deltaproteobacteria bacterium]|nr:D-alanine--D-alanine ligase [Deltaproteobacteria bacterium]